MRDGTHSENRRKGISKLSYTPEFWQGGVKQADVQFHKHTPQQIPQLIIQIAIRDLFNKPLNSILKCF